jgi:hypothetical protein
MDVLTLASGPFDIESLLAKLMGKHDFINRLKQTWAGFRVHFECSVQDQFGKFVFIISSLGICAHNSKRLHSVRKVNAFSPLILLSVRRVLCVRKQKRKCSR